MAEKRKDNKGRNLRTGESQRKDGRYMYRWTVEGKEKTVSALSLEELREKERQIQRDMEDGVDSRKADTTTLNDMFTKYMAGKTELKQSTRTNYNYMYKNYVHDNLGKKKLSKIKYSDVKAFYTSLLIPVMEQCRKLRNPITGRNQSGMHLRLRNRRHL